LEKSITSLNPLVDKALKKNPFDFTDDAEGIKSYLNELLLDKNLLLAFELIIYIELKIQVEFEVYKDRFINSLLDIVMQHKINNEQDKIPSFFDNFLLRHMREGDPNALKAYEWFRSIYSSKVNRFKDYQIRSEENCIYSNHPRTNGMSVVLSQGTHGVFTWKDHIVFKSVFDLAIYSMLLEELKPDVIIEIGSGKGGSAVWLADMTKILGLKSQIYSYDINKPDFSYPNVNFIEFDLNNLNDNIDFPENKNWVGSKLIIEDAHENISKVLNKIDSKVGAGDYLIVEDSDGKQKELFNFIKNTKNTYLTDQHYLDLFGRNGTSATNSIFKVV
jgi:cephalosporin hydroxylase|tara:strand:- start:8287 stop:9282 length:996 start_codon:yes stop_codon:yes gene_type:complete